MKKFKSIILCLLMSVCLILGCGCRPYTYEGENVELYTVAVNSIFGCNGYIPDGEIVHNPKIKIIEKDDYGRVLFYYCEEIHFHDKEHSLLECESGKDYCRISYACLIMQTVRDNYVYYYEDDCFDVYLIEKWTTEGLPTDLDEKDFSDLKERNDWGKELNEEKCIKKPVVKRNKPSLRPRKADYNEIIAAYIKTTDYKGQDYPYRFNLYSTSDSYGRELYYAWGVGFDALGEGVSPSSVREYFNFAIIFNPDGTYNKEICVTEIRDMIYFKDELIAFKELNHWNQPYIKE